MILEKKNKKEGFMKGVLVLMLSQVLIKLLGVLYKLYLTNKDGFGDVGNAINGSGYQIYALLLTISSVGVPNAISKLISEEIALGNNKEANRIFKISFALFAIVGFIGSAILFTSARYISQVFLQIPEAELTLVSLSPSVFFVTIVSVLRGYFNGRQKISITARSQTIEQVFKTILTILIVEIIGILSNLNTSIMAAGANIATTLSVFMSFIYLYIYFKLHRQELNGILKNKSIYRPKRVVTIVKRILYVSIPITLSAVAYSLNKNIDSFTVVRLLKRFMEDSQAKIQYGILSGKVDTLIMLPLSFNVAFATALVPSVAASLAKKDYITINKRISFSLLSSILIGLPCTFGMIIFANQILNLLFPNAPEGTVLLQWCSLTIILTLLIQTTNGALQGLGKVMVPAISGGVGLIIKLILNLILIPIPSIGVNGAAIASVIYHVFSFAIVFCVLRKTVKIEFNFSKHILKPLLATIIMCISSYYLYTILMKMIAMKFAVILSIMFAIIIYIVLIIILKIFTKEELLMLPLGKELYKVFHKIGLY